MVDFYMAVTCPICGEIIIKDGINRDYTADYKNNIPVINLDLFACTVFECENCGTEVSTGDSSCLYEYEEGQLLEEDSNNEY